MINLTIFEYSLLGLFFLLLILIGYLSSKKESKEEYLIADRKLGVLSSVSTIVASKVGGGLLVTCMALVYLYGISAIWLFFGFAFGYIIFYFFAIELKKLADKERYYTLSDYFFNRFSKSTGFLSAGILGISYFFIFVVQLIAGAKLLSVLTGFSYIFSLLIITSIILFYLILGGFKAVVKTDVIQYMAILVIVFFVAVFLTFNFGFKFDPVQWDLFKAGPKIIIPFFLGGLLVPLASPELWRRIYATKNLKTAKRSIIFANIFYVLTGLVLVFIGLIIRQNLPNIDPDLSLVLGFSNLLPTGFVGLGVIALFAAIMSSADTYIFTDVSIFAQDFYRRLKNPNKSQILKFIRVMLVFLALSGLILAYAIPSLAEIFFLYAGVVMLLSIMVIATRVNKKVSSFSLMLGMIFGILAMVIYGIFKGINPTMAFSLIIGGLFGLFLGEAWTITRSRL
ncbi:hypothetical protein DRJ17_03910 [Candidatus Woesearchaeota archaeon]|nr:MAG: hypothetical protein DRJ17_03910 [Candidatus Woesearchaeota archaeon]